MTPKTNRDSGRRLPVSGIGLLILGLVLLVIGVLHYFHTEDPRIMLDAHSEAVTFRTAGAFDLVQRAGLGLRPGEIESAGLGFDSVWVDSSDFQIERRPVPAAPSPARGDGAANRDSARRDVSQFLQGLAVDDGCEVHLERHSHDVTRLGFSAVPVRDSSGHATCRVRARLHIVSPSSQSTADGPRGPTLVHLDTTLDGRSTASLYVQRPEPFSLRDLSASGLRFERTHGDRAIESSILGGWIRIPEPRDREERLYYRDRLRLGQLSEGALRVTVGDSIRTFFRGKSSRPWLGRGQGTSLVPTLLQSAYHHEDVRVAVSLLGGIFTALGGIAKLLRP